mgnify:FL=1|tara:strand:+ start:2966 stop:3166 length:201 start_codon:yes stop_codon:yes gene_type:complete
MASKDQNSIDDTEDKDQKWNRGLDLFIESLHKPDNQLRACAHNQCCYVELMEVRGKIIEHVKTMRR